MSESAKGVWAYLQHKSTSLEPDSLELLAAGRKVADRLGQELVGIVLGQNVGEASREAVRRGADRVLYVDSPAFAAYFNLRYIEAISEMARQRNPYVFIFTANELGKDLAARVAYRLKTGLATDNVQLEVEDCFVPGLKQTFEDLLIQIRPDFGTRLARIYTPKTRPQMATVRPGNFAPLPDVPARKGVIEAFAFEERDYRALVKEVVELEPPKVDLKGADVVISLGLGVLKDGEGKPRNPKEAYDYALELKSNFEAMGLKAELGASRALVYAEVKELEGLLGLENQVGQTGATVSPRLYIAAGISGALQHRVGMMKSRKILAINSDPTAPIFSIAHYPIVGDLYQELPKLIAATRGTRLAA